MKRSKNTEQFEDLGFEDQDNISDDDNFDSYVPIDLADEDDPIELERRKQMYSSLRKTDKIFNNSYNMGQNDSGEDSKYNSSIKVDVGSSHYQLYDRDQYSDHIDNTITQRDIDNFVSSSEEILAILGDKPDKRKFTKIEVNHLFALITEGVASGEHASFFVSPIHVLDTISSLTNMEYKKLFDMLSYDYKETLLLELNKKYGFLDKPSKNFKMF
jgi:hypothetical protein